MKEVPFKLNQDGDGWPPIEVEWLWLSEIEGCLRVEHAPFFIEELAAGDWIKIEEYNQSGQVIAWKVIRKSMNSVLWISDLGDNDLDEILGSFREMGCNTSVLRAFDHAVVDIPASVSRVSIDDLLERIEGREIAVAFPCDRQT